MYLHVGVTRSVSLMKLYVTLILIARKSVFKLTTRHAETSLLSNRERMMMYHIYLLLFLDKEQQRHRSVCAMRRLIYAFAVRTQQNLLFSLIIDTNKGDTCMRNKKRRPHQRMFTNLEEYQLQKFNTCYG